MCVLLLWPVGSKAGVQQLPKQIVCSASWFRLVCTKPPVSCASDTPRSFLQVCLQILLPSFHCCTVNQTPGKRRSAFVALEHLCQPLLFSMPLPWTAKLNECSDDDGEESDGDQCAYFIDKVAKLNERWASEGTVCLLVTRSY